MPMQAVWSSPLVAGGVVAVAVAVALVVAAGAIGYVLVDRASRHHSATAADAVIVLGAEVVGQRPSLELQARLDRAVAVWAAGQAPVVVCCGGMSDGVDERDVMAAYLVEAGVPGAAVMVADGATTRRSVESVVNAGYTSVVMVTSPYHVRRAVAEARRHGLEAAGCPASGSPEQADSAVRRLRTATEVVALAWYALPVWVTSRVPTGPSTVRHRVPQALIGQVTSRRATRSPSHR
jgi:vancomycin permeability regulator SanA